VTSGFPARVRGGERVVGTFVKLSGLEAIDLVAAAGFDFAVVDLEHSQLGFSQASALLRHGAAIGLPTVVRIPDVDPALVNRLLEAGASGVQLSSLRRRASVAELRAATCHPPAGTRSVSLAQPAARYGAGGLVAYLAGEEAEPPLVIGQIETATTDDTLGELAAGLDVVFLGTTDLSVDLGLPGELSAAPVRARMEEVAAAASAEGVRLGGFAGDAAGVAALRRLGASYLLVGSDLAALSSGISSLAAAAATEP